MHLHAVSDDAALRDRTRLKRTSRKNTASLPGFGSIPSLELADEALWPLSNLDLPVRSWQMVLLLLSMLVINPVRC